MNNLRIGAVLLLCVIGGLLSLILLSKHYGVPLLGEAALAACGQGGGCDIVDQSRYARFLGLPLAAWGLFFYGSLLALVAPLLAAASEAAAEPALPVGFLLAAAAVAVDIVLFGLQLAIIKAFCQFCIATYVVNALLVATLWPFRNAAMASSFLGNSSRRGFAAWTVAVIAVAYATLAGNAGLETRKALASASILGFPLAPSSSHGVIPGSLEDQLVAAQAEAKKWKDTLDNEQRLQIYLTQKARDDFNKAEVLSLDLSKAPSQGAPDGPITVVTYSDFMCPFCRDLALGMRNYLPTSGNLVKHHYKNFPLDTSCNAQIGRTVHQGACEVALGGICAAESGRFWEYHDKVFAHSWQSGIAKREDVLGLGAAAGLDSAKLGACMNATATKGRLAAEIAEGLKIGVASTPTVVVNGRRLPSSSVFLLAVDEERKRLNLPVAATPATKK